MIREKIAVLVVTHNERNNISNLFKSLSEQTYNNFKIFIIDNNSKDDTLKVVNNLNNTYKFEVEIIKLKEDTGYTFANNIGANNAIKQGYPYLFIINNDIYIEKNCIAELLNLFSISEKVGITAPLLLKGLPAKQNIIQTFGAKADFKLQKKQAIYADNIFEETKLESELKVDYVCGAALMINGDIIRKHGLFDEKYFMYNDEIDFGYRMKNAGVEYYVTKKAIVWHNHDWTRINISGYKFMYYYMMRNRYLYFKKYRLYYYMIADLIKQIILFPFTFKMFYKIGSLKLLKYYYWGIIKGIIGEKGMSLINFK